MDSTLVVDPPINEIYEVSEWKGDDELPPPEFKPLPEYHRYEFLDNTKIFPIIINANLSGGTRG